MHRKGFDRADISRHNHTPRLRTFLSRVDRSIKGFFRSGCGTDEEAGAWNDGSRTSKTSHTSFPSRISPARKHANSPRHSTGRSIRGQGARDLSQGRSDRVAEVESAVAQMVEKEGLRLNASGCALNLVEAPEKELVLVRKLRARRAAAGTPCAYLEPDEELERLLEAFVERARKPWPPFRISPESFVEYVADRLTPAKPVQEALAELRAEDLWMIHACLEQDCRAIQEFEGFLRHLSRQLGIDREMSYDGRDDLLQQLRETLLVSRDAESAPRLSSYGGKGSFRAWLRVVLARERASYYRSRRKTISLSEAVEDFLLVEERDPELRALRHEHQAIFRQVFQAAIQRLDSENRLLLGHWVLDGMTYEQIGVAINAHRLTIGRRFGKLRKKLMMYLKLELTNRLNLKQAELESIMRCMESHFEASLSAMLLRQRKMTQKGW